MPNDKPHWVITTSHHDSEEERRRAEFYARGHFSGYAAGAASVKRKFTGNMDGMSFAKGADLSGSVFGGDRFGPHEDLALQANGAKIEWADMSKCEIRNAVMQDGHWSGTNMAGSKFSASSMARGDFTSCDLSGSNIYDVCFEMSNMLGADFTGCNLHDVGLEGADLSGSWLDGVDLTRCRLDDAKFDRAHIEGIKINVDQLISCPSLMQRVVEMYLTSRARGFGSAAIEAVVQESPPTSPTHGEITISVRKFDDEAP